MINYLEELKEATSQEERTEKLLAAMDEIVAIGGRRKQANTVNVTEEELDGLRYLMLRDKEGLGDIEPLIMDPYIEDIICSGLGSIFVEHRIFGGLKVGIAFETHNQLDRFVIRLSEKINRPVTVRDPIVDAVLPDGSRVNIVYGDDVSKRGSNFTIRKFSATPFSILDLVSTGTLSYEMAAYISIMLGKGMNTFVSGETASGKTTMLNAITTFINPNAKIVSIEDTPELQVPHKNWIREVTRGSAGSGASVNMFDLLRAALRQRPNEIIIGEIRGEEGASLSSHADRSRLYGHFPRRLSGKAHPTPHRQPHQRPEDLRRQPEHGHHYERGAAAQRAHGQAGPEHQRDRRIRPTGRLLRLHRSIQVGPRHGHLRVSGVYEHHPSGARGRAEEGHSTSQ